MKRQDRLGRRLFTTHTENPIPDYKPNERQLQWMQFLNLHGFASSLYLHEYTADTHRCPQTSKRMLRKLFDGQMIYRPRQQRETENADGNYHVYALTKAGINYLKEEGLWLEAHKPTGGWVHQYMVSCITASIHILCNREGYHYIPGHEITPSLTAEAQFTWGSKEYSYNIIPDALFAIQYPTGYVAYALEADRGTEPNDTASPYRKSIRRNIKQYAYLVGNQAYKSAYRLNCPLIVLNVMVSKRKVENALTIIQKEVGDCPYLAFGLAPEFKTPFKPPAKLLESLFIEPLHRSGLKPWTIKQVQKKSWFRYKK